MRVQSECISLNTYRRECFHLSLWPLKNVTRDFHSIAQTLFVEYVTDVVLDRPHADLQFRGYLFVTQSARNRDGDTVLGFSHRFVLKTQRSVVFCIPGANQPRNMRVS